ncbi:DegV family protein [Bengtsoniella intestinalis]|uniref:DegV family protein n=1 Tax=Bengtsoniella intestinalis TaxID=3073143 RepID=UPI00391F4023
MIRITADSTCDLPQALLDQYHIAISPLGVVKGDALFRDGVDITTQAIVAHVENGGEITTTNAVNIADYYLFFQEEIKGYDGLVHINLGAGFSSCYQNACLAASEFENVVALDSENLSIGHGIVVLTAARVAAQGGSIEEITAAVKQVRSKVETSFVLETLDYMKKGGRCSTVTALGANLLKLHPCIEVVDGKMTVTKKYRGSMEKVMVTYVEERLSGREDIDPTSVYLADSCHNPDHSIVAAAHKALVDNGTFEQIIPTAIGCTILCHCGPNTLGFVFVRK